jgi:uncharacterized membrane protein
MPELAIALSLHVLGVVWWIGGLAFVTAILLPELRRDPKHALESFRAIEHRFAPQVRGALLVVGASGAWMLYRLGLWHMLDNPRFWWLDAMLALWALFFLMLFVLGPLGVLGHIMSGALERNLARRLARMHRLHALLLILALITIAGAVAGSHGLG